VLAVTEGHCALNSADVDDVPAQKELRPGAGHGQHFHAVRGTTQSPQARSLGVYQRQHQVADRQPVAERLLRSLPRPWLFMGVGGTSVRYGRPTVLVRSHGPPGTDEDTVQFPSQRQ
jgi:hypothetical protein